MCHFGKNCRPEMSNSRSDRQPFQIATAGTWQPEDSTKHRKTNHCNEKTIETPKVLRQHEEKPATGSREAHMIRSPSKKRERTRQILRPVSQAELVQRSWSTEFWIQPNLPALSVLHNYF